MVCAAPLSHLCCVPVPAGALCAGCTHTGGALPPSTAMQGRETPQEPGRGPLHPLQLAETALQPRESLLGNRNRNVMS